MKTRTITIADILPRVYSRNGSVLASSREVAALFGKRHDNVLRDIDRLIADAPACASNFEETSETVAMPRGGTRQSRSYDMTRDGFTLLAMGFSGNRALAFKVRYIEEFNRMEAQLNATAPPDLMDPADAAIAWAEQYKTWQASSNLAVAARAWADEQERRQAAGARLIETKPQAPQLSASDDPIAAARAWADAMEAKRDA